MRVLGVILIVMQVLSLLGGGLEGLLERYFK